ncbi:HD domain-containing protein [Tenacibaculum jejuense]|uniref:Guanosine polyphosphate pyrophosphohydrolase n=1 Tax=Tenacibaculum jejuense TaxID=584609 RepID=A0A238U544_9FLAO|nr:HD domain-containing protein [Tenacibaculum jejuense]SNR14136.1 Guanosine polyphosphate pyrophosphohydrolase [Tenacibaculum jejuense]
MIQELYQNAMKFAGEKHCNQQVPGTKANYLLHISNVVMEVIIAHNYDNSFDINLAVQTAILHDTIEDTDTSFEEISLNFGKAVAEGVLALTKDEKLSTKEKRMRDSLDRINKLSKEIGIVKIADRITNLQEPPKHWNQNKIENYLKEAQLISNELSGKNDCLNNRLLQKIEAYSKFIKSKI